jgi:hypothetical protein
MAAHSHRHRWFTVAFLSAGCLLTAAHVLSPAFGEATRVGDLYSWRNELNTDVFTQEKIMAWVPDTNAVVRGFIFLGSHGGCPGAENREWVRTATEWRRFAAHYGFGLMATGYMCGSEYNMKNTNLLLKALQEMAAAGIHPEIENVPLIPIGSSNAGATGYSLVNLIPGKILCSFLNVTAGFDPNPPTAGGIKVPVMFTVGELDFSRDRLEPVVANARSRGGLWSFAEVQRMAHEEWRAYHLSRPFFEKCIALRYPQGANPRSGPVVLNDITESSGWLGGGDDSWHSGVNGIYSYAEYPGNKAGAQWFVDEDMAVLHRGLVAWNMPIDLQMFLGQRQLGWSKPADTVFITEPGVEARLRVVPNGFSWNRIEFFRGRTKLGEVTSGEPEFTFTLGTQSLAQGFTVLAHDATETQTAHPWSVVVMEAETPVRLRDSCPRITSRRYDRGTAPRWYDLTGRAIAAAGRAYDSRNLNGVLIRTSGGVSRTVVAP